MLASSPWTAHAADAERQAEVARFDAQLSDHGADAMPGHQHHHGHVPKE